MWNWYGHHYARILRAGVQSDKFSICRPNGVCQGGILSPFLFGVDELSRYLQSINIGCRLGNMIINHFLFADDAVVFDPSAKGLKKLLGACSEFAVTHNVICNVIKSQCLIVQSRTAPSYRPTFRLCGDALPSTESYKYLRHIINSNLADDADVMKQTRALYARANTIIRKFSAASLSTKLLLFRALYSIIWLSALVLHVSVLIS